MIGVHPYRKTKRAGRGRATVAASADGRESVRPNKDDCKKLWLSSFLYITFLGIFPE
jgi:hypothetical protein